MPASESTPAAPNLHESIEQLIAEAMRKSQSAHEAEKEKLTAALSAALADIQTSQLALSRAADALHVALGLEPDVTVVAPDSVTVAEPERDEPTPQPVAQTTVEVTPFPTSDRGSHELDVIAHGVGIGYASGLQSLLRDRPEVESAQTREFVNGELRLHLALSSGLDMNTLGAWLVEHDGELVTTTDSVIEVRFGR